MKQGQVHIFMDDLRRWLELAAGNRMTSHALGRRLRLCMAQPEQLNVKIGGARTTRTCWKLSTEDRPAATDSGENEPELEPETEQEPA